MLGECKKGDVDVDDDEMIFLNYSVKFLHEMRERET